MASRILTAALICSITAGACSGGSANNSNQATEAADQGVRFTKKVLVLGVPIHATSTTTDEKLLHAAGVLAQFLDNDEDGEPDNPAIHQAILETHGNIVMTSTGREVGEIDWANAPRGQGLYDEETHPNARQLGIFDGSWEEIFHMITDNGLAVAYPDVFGKQPGSEVADAMDLARGGRFEWPPDQYPDGAWYTYYDETCDYDCMISEYVYWAYTTLIGAQDFPGRLEDIEHEWPLTTPARLEEGDPAMYEILTREEYRLGTVLPDGNYSAATLTVEAYEHQ